MKDKKEIIFKAFLLGQEIKLGEAIFKLFKKGETINLSNGQIGEVTDADPYWLGIKFYNKLDMWIGVPEYSFSEILRLMDKIPEDEVFLLAGNNALIEINKRK